MQKWKEISALLRVSQWAKNLLIFIPVFFAAKADDLHTLPHVFHAFISFCLMASAVYILNDYLDIQSDQHHPAKKNRPLANGTISKRSAAALGSLLFVISLVFAWTVNQNVIFTILFYFLLNLAYSFYLKRIAILDVSIIAVGFLLRIFAGGFAANVPVSNWLIVLTFLLALILALGKRRGEMVSQGSDFSSRSALQGYSLPFIDSAITFLSAITVVAYLMYTLSPEVVHRIGSDQIYFTTLFVILGMLRYLQLTFVYQKTESPTQIFWKDAFIQILLICWIGSFGYLLYFA